MLRCPVDCHPYQQEQEDLQVEGEGPTGTILGHRYSGEGLRKRLEGLCLEGEGL